MISPPPYSDLPKLTDADVAVGITAREIGRTAATARRTPPAKPAEPLALLGPTADPLDEIPTRAIAWACLSIVGTLLGALLVFELIVGFE